jgi:Ca2+-transporting ATPase
VAGSTLGLYFWELARNDPAEHARALAFATLLVSAMLLVLVSRSSSLPVWRVSVTNNSVLFPALVLFAGVLAIVFGIPAVRSVFEMGALHPADWLIVAVAAPAGTLWTEPFKKPPTPPVSASGAAR